MHKNRTSVTDSQGRAKGPSTAVESPSRSWTNFMHQDLWQFVIVRPSASVEESLGCSSIHFSSLLLLLYSNDSLSPRDRRCSGLLRALLNRQPLRRFSLSRPVPRNPTCVAQKKRKIPSGILVPFRLLFLPAWEMDWLVRSATDGLRMVYLQAGEPVSVHTRSKYSNSSLAISLSRSFVCPCVPHPLLDGEMGGFKSTFCKA